MFDHQTFDEERLIRTISHALRHDPWKYGLEIDIEGWTSLNDLVLALRFDRYDWAMLEPAIVERIVRGNDPGRFEICDARVRAVYGHSIDLAKMPPIECPPELLFHGTAQEALAGIFANGLLPMGRRFVHLTAKQDYAIQIAEVRNPGSVLLIDARTAYDRGHVFRRANQHVWLTEIVEPCFLRLNDNPVGNLDRLPDLRHERDEPLNQAEAQRKPEDQFETEISWMGPDADQPQR